MDRELLGSTKRGLFPRRDEALDRAWPPRCEGVERAGTVRTSATGILSPCRPRSLCNEPMGDEEVKMSSTVIPCLRYRDAPRMIGWLCDIFGFKRHAVYEDGQGGIAHAQLTLGPGMIMLGSAREGDDPFGRVQSTPAALGGTTQSPYLVVTDADE